MQYFVITYMGKESEKEYICVLMNMLCNKVLEENENCVFWDFPGGTVVKNPPANAGDTGSIPGPGRSHMPRSN